MVESDAEKRFQEYCEKQCVSRRVNLNNLMLKDKSMLELVKFLRQNEFGIARLSLRENMLRDNGIAILAEALAMNQSIVQLDIC